MGKKKAQKRTKKHRTGTRRKKQSAKSENKPDLAGNIKTAVKSIPEILPEIVLPNEPVKRFRKGLFIMVMCVSVIMLVLLFAGLKINFSIKDELSPRIIPATTSLNAVNNQSIQLNFSLEIVNFRQCKTYCRLSFIDSSEMKVLMTEEVILEHKETADRSYNIVTPEHGEGQKIFNIKAECSNIRSTTCLTESPRRHRSSLVTINYKLSEEQKSFKHDAQVSLQIILDYAGKIVNNLDALSVRLGMLSAYHEIRMLRMSHAEKVNASRKYLETKDVLVDFWQHENYKYLAGRDWNDLYRQAETIIKGIESDMSSAEKYLLLQNQINSQLETAANTSKKLLALGINLETTTPTAENLLANIKDMDSLVSINDLSDRVELHTDLLFKLSELLEKQRTKADFLTAFASMILSIRQNQTFVYEEYNCEKYAVLFAELKESNEELSQELEHLALMQLKQYLNDTGGHEEILKLVEQELRLYDSYYSSLKGTAANLDRFSFEKCTAQEYPALVLIANFKPEYAENVIIFRNATIFTLNENYPKCCALANCSVCCDNECEPAYPVILLHGHSFNQKNRPEASLNSFAKLQESMRTHVNAGELNLAEKAPTDWGRSNVPVSVRATYYYISTYDIAGVELSVQKDERIENYALRLREIIDEVKHRTGAGKVNLIALSMGGLVVREYLSIFGADSTDKVILVNSPNHGISGRTEKFCSLLGSDKGCEDLKAGSVFMNRLNSQPVTGNIHVIRSIGCETNGKQGDGIVEEDSAYLEGAKNYVIEGECTDSLGINLHTGVLDPQRHPELLELVLDILAEG